MKYFDTHCHLHYPPLNEEIDKIILDCKEKSFGVNIVGTDHKSNFDNLSIAKKYQNFYTTIGIHPNYCQNENWTLVWKDFNGFLENKTENKIIGIGETGLDFSYCKPEEKQATYKLQKKWFLEHRNLAIKHDLPLILHVRDAHDEMIEILKEFPHFGIVHFFSSNIELAKKYLDLKGEWMFSIPGVITFKSAKSLKEAIAWIPIEKLLIETDAPWVAPAPYWGKTNYPYYSIEVLKTIASIKNIPFDECAEIIFKNTKTIFKNIK